MGICDPLTPDAGQLQHPGQSGLIPRTGVEVMMRLLHQAFFHRVAVDVAQLLLNDVRSAQPNGMQVVLPELNAAFRTAQMSKEPFTAALLRVLLDGLHHGLGRELLVVAQDVL